MVYADMNVYDFDNTIYDGDSSVNFYLFCIGKQPGLLRFLPLQFTGLLGYIFKYYNKSRMKERFYSYFRGVRDLDAYIDEFWSKNESKIKSWYRAQGKEDDLIISASPEILLHPICRRLNIKRLIASKIDAKTGRHTEGENCHGKDKVYRYLAEYGECGVDEFYSDSLSDTPMAEIARKSFFVTGDKLTPWPEKTKYGNK